MVELKTDFNVAPYYDDYNEDKQYYRILFRPATAVQARELTQLQTMMQKQISRFGNSIYRDGTIIEGVNITPLSRVDQIKIKESSNTIFSLLTPGLTEKDNYLLVSNTTNLRASIFRAFDGEEPAYPDTNRIYVKYLNTGSNSGVTYNTFKSTGNEQIDIYSTAQSPSGTLNGSNKVGFITSLTTTASINCLGVGYGARIAPGIIYQKGFFQKVTSQNQIVVEHSTNAAGYIVGFDTAEYIVQPTEDSSLYDNSIGSTNYNAPGAHRLKLVPSLISYDTANNEVVIPKNFLPVMEFDGGTGRPVERHANPQLSLLGDALARRTSEESGDYIVKPFQISIEDHESNTQSFYYKTTAGIAYVDGYRIEFLSGRKTEAPRAIETDWDSNQVATANFGNYVEINEFVGTLDTQSNIEIALYNTAQKIISTNPTASSPSGTLVGYANARAVIYEDGTKGLSSATYLLYLFNVRIQTGYSFANDVKSFYVNGSYGKVFGDIVLDSNSKAILQEAKNAIPLFNTGLASVKRLASNTGAYDTSYYYRNAVTPVSLGITGQATFGTPGPDTWAYGVGFLGATDQDELHVTFAQDTYSSNLIIDGTTSASSNATHTTITSSGAWTGFGQVDYTTPVGSLVAITNTTSTFIRRVTAVPGTTSIIITPNTNNSQTSLRVKKFFREGQPVDFSGTGNTAQVLSTTSLQVNLALTPDSSAYNLNAQILLNRGTASQANKDVKKDIYVKIDCSTGGITGPWNLGLADTFNLKAVYFGTTYANTNTNKVDWFSLDDGQADTHYNHGKLVLKPQYKNNLTSSTRLLVLLDHFSVNVDSTHAGYFSVDSYPIDNANTANTNAIQTGQIPYYYSSTTSKSYDLRNVIDFRPYKTTTANSTTLVANATINPTTSNTFTLMGTSSSKIIEPDTNITYDVEYYLERKDLLVLNKDGDLAIKQGKSDIRASTPSINKEGLVLAEITVPPFPSLTNKQAETFKRNDIVTTANVKQYRGYTMRDIGAIDERIKRIEYYTVLNALEQDTKSMSVKDANGLDRFKNGIFADPFNDHNIGKTFDPEYSVAVDSRKSLMRPNFNELFYDFQLIPSTSTNYKASRKLLMIDYDSEIWVKNPFATTYRNCTQNFYTWNGKLNLYPEYDGYEDNEAPVKQTVTIDTTAGIKQLADMGVFKDVAKKVDTSVKATSTRSGDTITTARTTTTTTSTTIKDISVKTETETVNVGSMLTDVTLLPYMRSRIISVIGVGFRPGARLYVYFDGQAVSQHCRPAKPADAFVDEDGDVDYTKMATLAVSNPNAILTPTGKVNTAITADSVGTVYFQFILPANTFRNGDRKMEVLNTDTNTARDAILTSGAAVYTASALSTKSTNLSFNIIQPVLDYTNKTTVDTKVDVVTETRRIPTPTPIDTSGGDRSHCDPIGETFEIRDIGEGIPGVYLTQVGVYFKSKSATLGITMHVSPCIGGVPDSFQIVGSSYKKSKQVSVSADSSVETIFEFNSPILLQQDQYFCFWFEPDGANPDYEIWVSEVGGVDKITGRSITTQPYNGVLVVSSNSRSWNVIQSQDLKFNLYRAKFKSRTATVVLGDENDEYFTVDGFTKEVGQSINVGDVVYVANTSNTSEYFTNTSVYGFGTVQSFNEADGILTLDGSNGKFTTARPVLKIFNVNNPANTAEIVVGNLVATANLISIDNLKYHGFIPKLNILEPLGTSVTLNYYGTANSTGFGAITGYQKDTKSAKLTNRDLLDYNDYERVVLSYSNRVTIGGFGANGSATVVATLRSNSDYVSPVIDISTKSMLLLENIINNDVTNEHTKYGEAKAKYISRNVVLADGQEAEDLEIYVTGYRPNGTDIKVYVKFLNGTDPDPFDEKLWTLMSYRDSGNLVYSSPSDTSNYIEYRFGVPSTAPVSGAAYLNASSTPANILSYTTPSGTSYEGFKTYSIKIIMTSTNPAKTPLLGDVRALALQA